VFQKKESQDILIQICIITSMKLRLYVVLAISICLISISPITTISAKYSWDIFVDANTYDSRIFTVQKDNLMIKMRVKVFEGGPVSVFILDENSYATWNGGYGPEVVAYAGTSNITIGIPATISGQLGLARDNSSGMDINYYIVVDNRGTGVYSNVQVEVIQTLPHPSVYLAILTLIPLALIFKLRKTKANKR
jgi:hypothetical protein